MFYPMFLILSLFCASSAFGTTGNSQSYSNVFESKNWVYVSAQLPTDPHTGLLIKGNMQALTQQVIMNLEAALATEGLTLQDVIKTEVYLTDMRDYQVMDETYKLYFKYSPLPARDVIGVASLLYGSRIQIACIARKN